MDATALLRQRLASLTIAPPRHVHRLTVFPLLASPVGIPCLPLASALREGVVELRERDQASVPLLLLINHGPTPVFVLDGEEVVGGLQNRAATASALIAGGTSVELPVSCVEQGRWRDTRERFRPGETSHARLRALSQAAVSHNLTTRGARVSDQQAVWDEVRHKAREMAAAAPTEALHDVYRGTAGRLGEIERALPPEPEACGLAVAVAGRVVALDLFNEPALCAAYWPRLVRGAALDALAEERLAEAASQELVTALLREAANAAGRLFPALSLGQDLRLTSRRLTGAALLHEGHIVHLALFPAERQARRPPNQQAGRVASPRQRAGWSHQPPARELEN